MYESIYMKCPEQGSLQREQIHQWLSWAGERKESGQGQVTKMF